LAFISKLSFETGSMVHPCWLRVRQVQSLLCWEKTASAAYSYC